MYWMRYTCRFTKKLVAAVLEHRPTFLTSRVAEGAVVSGKMPLCHHSEMLD
jgi:hypothetical protein